MERLSIDTLVNKENPLSISYVPSDLIAVDNNEYNFHGYSDPNLKPMVSSQIYIPFLDLEMASVYDGLHITVDSGYRSAQYQRELFMNRFLLNRVDIKAKFPDINPEELDAEAYKLTISQVAKMGCSEHQTGYAFDIACYRNGEYSAETTDEERGWMNENAHRFGFILRYPKGKEEITGFSFEPWHYRYVGNDIANRLYNGGDWITLEEYHKSLKLKL